MEPALNHSCLYIPVLSEDALRVMKQTSYIHTEDTFFTELVHAMALVDAKRLVILPLLVGQRTLDDTCVCWCERGSVITEGAYECLHYCVLGSPR